MNGKKEFSYDVHQNKAKVLCAALDLAQRRMGVGYSDGRLKLVSANSGSLLCEIDKTYLEGGCVYIKFAMIFSQKRWSPRSIVNGNSVKGAHGPVNWNGA